MTTAVYKAFTADGDVFDFCTAEDEAMARAIISHRYESDDKEHFVGDLNRKSAELLDGFRVEVDPTVASERANEYARLAEAHAAALAHLPDHRAWKAGEAAMAAFKKMTAK